MNKSLVYGPRGFTLLEVMVALVIGVFMIGGVMGMISASLQYSQRVREMTRIQPILDAAAQEILARPELVEEGSISLASYPGSPSVRIEATQVLEEEGKPVENRSGRLYRVNLVIERSFLELSVIVTKPQENGRTETDEPDA